MVRSLVILAAVGLASPANADLPPPAIECEDNADCEECTVCQGGQCIGLSGFANCHCHAECGEGRCVLTHEDRPNCGGMCAPEPPEDDLPCGEGHDVLVVTETPVVLAPVDGGPERMEEGAPLDAAAPGGCDCRSVRGRGWLGAAAVWIVALMLAGRRRWRG